jgi:hypothetical protein
MKGQIKKNEQKNVDEKKECWLMFSLGLGFICLMFGNMHGPI